MIGRQNQLWRNVTLNLCRLISTGNTNLSNHFALQGRFMKKLMVRDATKKKWKKSSHEASVPTLGREKRAVSSHVSRRMIVLNKLFMKHITDYMATGEAEEKLVDRGIEISEVKVTSDYKKINVYWFRTEIDEEEQHIDELLKTTAIRLRHELSQLRVIGVVPPIEFVKSKHYSLISEVDKMLATADFGEDFEPTSHLNRPGYKLFSNRKSESEGGSDTENDINETENDEDTFAVSLPEMRHDVFRLDHEKIMAKIKASMHKSKMATENRLTNDPLVRTTNSKSSSVLVANYVSEKEEKEAFSKFLSTRIIKENRRKRECDIGKHQLEQRYLLELLEERERDAIARDNTIHEPIFDDTEVEELK